MTKYRNDLKYIKFSNGGSVCFNGINFHFSNTCTVDYWLLAITLYLNNSSLAKQRISDKSSVSMDLNKVLVNIKNFIMDNQWNMARLEWATFIGLKKKIINGEVHYNFFDKLSLIILEKMGNYQSFFFKYKCKKNCFTNGEEKNELSHDFLLM